MSDILEDTPQVKRGGRKTAALVVTADPKISSLGDGWFESSDPGICKEFVERVLKGILSIALKFAPSYDDELEDKKIHHTIPLIGGTIVIAAPVVPYLFSIQLNAHELCKKKSELRDALTAVLTSISGRFNYKNDSDWLKANGENVGYIRVDANGVFLANDKAGSLFSRLFEAPSEEQIEAVNETFDNVSAEIEKCREVLVEDHPVHIDKDACPNPMVIQVWRNGRVGISEILSNSDESPRVQARILKAMIASQEDFSISAYELDSEEPQVIAIVGFNHKTSPVKLVLRVLCIGKV